MKKFQVAPFDQHLSCNGRDLNDNQATLASLRIYPGTLIILQVCVSFIHFWLIEMFHSIRLEGGISFFVLIRYES